MVAKLRHFIIWFDKSKGMQSKYRASHKAMEKEVNGIISDSEYTKGSLKVFLGFEELKVDQGEELL